jgi:uncharacterized protein YgbK (DUF1537 family)
MTGILLLKMPGVAPVEVNVEQLPVSRDALLAEITHKCKQIHIAGQTPVVFTSRSEKIFSDQATRLAFGNMFSAFLMDVVRNFPRTLGFLISKGGITSRTC